MKKLILKKKTKEKIFLINFSYQLNKLPEKLFGYEGKMEIPLRDDKWILEWINGQPFEKCNHETGSASVNSRYCALFSSSCIGRNELMSFCYQKIKKNYKFLTVKLIINFLQLN